MELAIQLAFIKLDFQNGDPHLYTGQTWFYFHAVVKYKHVILFLVLQLRSSLD